MVKKVFFFLFSAIIIWSCNNNEEKQAETEPASTTSANAVPAPAQISYSVLNVYPHDTAAFTQGLIYYNNHLYEGTGQKKASTVRKVDYKTGAILQKASIDPSLFGEGITIIKDTLYQLTWQDHVILVYSLKDFKLIRKAYWNSEGWGITHDNTNLIISDGTDKLYFVRPADMKLMKIVSVAGNMGPVNNLNELEYINGYIYANQWETDNILKIDPSSGFITGIMDFSNALKKFAGINYDKETQEEGAVLNGIAWDSAGNRLFITGKLWPKLLEVKIN